MKMENPLIGMVIKTFFCCWVSSHIGIRGNEKADSAATSAPDLPRVKVGVPYTILNIYHPIYFSTLME